MTRLTRVWLVATAILTAAAWAGAQDTQVGPPIPLVHMEGSAAPPIVVTLPDAIARAKANDAQFQASAAEAQIAREDRIQAKASLLPAFSFTTQYLGNQANGVNPNGRFVSMDGVNMYRSWVVARQDLSPNTFGLTPYHRAQAAEALALARAEIAARGLVVATTQRYYALVAAERRYATAQQGAQQAKRFFDVTTEQERLGQVAHSDAVKAEISYQQQQQGFQDAALAIESTRLALAVMLFPTLTENFTVVDDLGAAPPLPPFADIRTLAERANPDLRVAGEALRVATEDVSLARNALYPSVAIEAVYGIEANEFALHSAIAAEPQFGVLPNLGYAVTVNLTVPVWDWGGLRSKVAQSHVRERQAQVELNQAQRQLVGRLYLLYNEALAARSTVDSLRHIADLAAESLRLSNLRYRAGESSALEVVDAQNTLVQARNAHDDAESRYRVALAELQTMTGVF